MTAVHSFPPLADAAARLLILGSMPGRRSLQEQRYYAHPRNAFWPIMGALLDFPPLSPYEQRCRALLAGGVALWDVMASCSRHSSLDADIVEDSIVPNDIALLLAACPSVAAVFFNGGKAEQSFRRHVLPTLGGLGRELRFERLPSTSPAHAGLGTELKLARWRDALGGLLGHAAGER